MVLLRLNLSIVKRLNGSRDGTIGLHKAVDLRFGQLNGFFEDNPLDPVHGEFLIMRLLVSETIPDIVSATYIGSGLPVTVGLSQLLSRGFVDPGSDGSPHFLMAQY